MGAKSYPESVPFCLKKCANRDRQVIDGGSVYIYCDECVCNRNFKQIAEEVDRNFRPLDGSKPLGVKK